MPNKRNEHARIAQSGASNPRPLAYALWEAIGECYTEGTPPNTDPAVALIFHQLAYLLGQPTVMSHEHWQACMSKVEEQA